MCEHSGLTPFADWPLGIKWLGDSMSRTNRHPESLSAVMLVTLAKMISPAQYALNTSPFLYEPYVFSHSAMWLMAAHVVTDNASIDQ